MKIFRFMIAAAMAIILMTSVCVGIFAKDLGNLTVGQHILKVGNKNIQVEVGLNDKKYTITTNYPLNGSDSQAVITALNEYAKSLNAINGDIDPDGYLSGWDQWDAYAYATDSTGHAYVYGNNTVKFNHTGWNVDVHGNGGITGYWTGSGTPSSITLSETLSISGFAGSVNITWPFSFTPGSDTYTASYTSSPFPNTTYANSPYSGMYAYSSVALYSYTQADSSVIRINNTDYRQYSSIYTSWLNGQCTTATYGGNTHTSG